MAGAAALMEQIEVQFEHVVLVIAELISLPGCQLIQFNHDDTHLDTLLDFRGATAAAVQWRPCHRCSATATWVATSLW